MGVKEVEMVAGGASEEGDEEKEGIGPLIALKETAGTAGGASVVFVGGGAPKVGALEGLKTGIV